nr:hypothetical protein L203_05545 [Cryptococcus depauperatus CBS 7841]
MTEYCQDDGRERSVELRAICVACKWIQLNQSGRGEDEQKLERYNEGLIIHIFQRFSLIAAFVYSTYILSDNSTRPNDDLNKPKINPSPGTSSDESSVGVRVYVGTTKATIDSIRPFLLYGAWNMEKLGMLADGRWRVLVKDIISISDVTGENHGHGWYH